MPADTFCVHGVRFAYLFTRMAIETYGSPHSTLNLYSQVLLEAPVGTGLGIVMGITGMGANDFMDFLLSYFVDLGLIMLFRVNIDPALGDILEAIGEM